eukprot:4244597-Prymnesium_polylepis.1
MDEMLVCRLEQGDIRLLDRKFIVSKKGDWRMKSRQELERISPEAFISPDDAVAMVSKGDRHIGVLSYGWPTREDPDPQGAYLKALRKFLKEQPSVLAVFWDFACVPQRPRSPVDEVKYQAALGVMVDLYASPRATTVLRLA